jgi:Uncharacterized conserved protein (DUF2267)
MISHSDLVTAVQRRAGLDADAAGAAISAATGAMACQMLNEGRERLATLLPDTARYATAVLSDVESPDGHEVIRDVARQLNTTPERARKLTQAVLAVLDEAEPGLVHLPPGVREVLGA